MFRTLRSIGVGILLGGTAILATIDSTTAPADLPKTSATSCPAVVPSDAVVSARSSVINRPNNIQSVNRAIANDSEFDKQLALFELAGEADSPTLQKLIFDASQINKFSDRRKALLVFFGRLTEMDPRSALALAQLDTIAGNKTILQRVWQLWAIDDLASALQEVARLPSAFDREVAAQAMLRAHDYLGEAAIHRISAATGISPNVENRVRYLRWLADKSPANAFDHVNQISSAHKQREAIIHLARYLAQQYGGRATGYANLLAVPDQQEHYLAVVIRKIAEVDPRLALTALSTVNNAAQRYDLRNVIFGQLARNDVFLAKRLADQLIDTPTRDLAYYTIIQHHARIDPVEAAGWASLITNQQVRQYAERQVRWAIARLSQ